MVLEFALLPYGNTYFTLRLLEICLGLKGLIRQELTEKVHILKQQTEKQIFMIKCPCNYQMSCNHMAGLTEDLILSWHPLQAEIQYFFMNQPFQHLGILLYPHCIDCLDPSICGSSN